MHIISTVQIQLGTNAVISAIPQMEKREQKCCWEPQNVQREAMAVSVSAAAHQAGLWTALQNARQGLLPGWACPSLQPAATTGHSRSHWGNLKSLLLFVSYLNQGGILLPPLSVPSRPLVKHLCSVSPSFSEDPWLIKNRSIVQRTGSVLC